MSLFSFFIDAFHFIYLFLAALGLCCFAWPSLVVISASFLCGGFSYCEAQALATWFNNCMWLAGLVAPWHVESSGTRD